MAAGRMARAAVGNAATRSVPTTPSRYVARSDSAAASDALTMSA